MTDLMRTSLDRVSVFGAAFGGALWWGEKMLDGKCRAFDLVGFGFVEGLVFVSTRALGVVARLSSLCLPPALVS